MQYMIGVDIGTTNTKAIAFSTGGQVLGLADASYTAFSDQPGWHELDPDQLFGAVITALKELGEKVDHRQELCGISFSCAMHSLIAVDGGGNPLTRAMTWADLRSQSYATALKGTGAGKLIYRQTGTPIYAMSPLCKLLWLKDNSPAIFQAAAKFIGIKEYIWHRLFGNYEIDHSIASATGLFDIYGFDWYAGSLELAGISADRLSRPVPSTHRAPALLPEYAHLLGLPPGLPFIIGGSDGCLANLGSQAVRPGETALTIGTSGAVRMTTTKPEHDPKERIFNYILTERLYVSGGATNNGGGVLQWYMENFLGRGADGAKDLAVMVEEAATVAPGSEGLVFLPYLQGERAPLWDAEAKGVFFGIRSAHQQRHFMRAVLEGISFSLFQVGVSLEETIGPITCIYASGGFIRSKTWLQLVADIFNKKVCVTGTADASAIGAAIMGMYALQLIGGLEEAGKMIQVVETYIPDKDRHRIYRQRFAVFTSLYERLKGLE
jgi:gluconokinase